MTEWRHLNWSGRVSKAWYPIRRVFVRPAPADDRCAMGSPVGPDVHRPRRALAGGLWCRRHLRAARWADGSRSDVAVWLLLAVVVGAGIGMACGWLAP